ncbi:MAG: tRNA 5-methoxyuridine(34)/uridine 5-oxyacetic acid(34) synthase CmoB [Oligoflexia bacterium]|nr:tRNA 5-methoxyuridine(34)/uridine 5-oxyacetic acid(34) synthase CmoB [Oligoflexia bacterium]
MLDYLLPYKKNILWDELLALKKERDLWWERPSAQKFLRPIEEAPIVESSFQDFKGAEIRVGLREEISDEVYNQVLESAKSLIPWKKGPFNIFETLIDAEWRSDQKWDRLLPHLPSIENKTVLDIGCNNGYFMFRMAEYNPKMVLGIDPVLPFSAQFQFIQKYAQNNKIHHELFGVEHLGLFKEVFDVIFSMGIIYHHRNPIAQLVEIREALVPGGEVIIETIGIPGEESYALFPEDRYARMGNTWFVPTLSCFINWLKKAKFIDVEVVADSDLTEDEQRLTDWCPPPMQSLKDSLDENDPSKTIEGHPAPRRFCLKAKKKGGK